MRSIEPGISRSGFALRAPRNDKRDWLAKTATKLDRVRVENVRRAVELVERRLQRGHAVLGDGLRGPAFGAVNRTQRAGLTHQEDLVQAHRKNLPGDILRGVAEQKRADRSDLFRSHLL